MFRTLDTPQTWIVTLSAAGILLITMGARQSLGLFVAPLNAGIGVDIASISLALAIGQFVWDRDTAWHAANLTVNRQSIGIAANNAVMEVFVNLEGGSWTITVTMTNGITCLVASGQAFENVVEAQAPKGDPA